MKAKKIILSLLSAMLFFLLIVACNPGEVEGECQLTANEALTAYRFPDENSDVFGSMFPGESFKVLARTSDGWLGFDPGVAQAGFIGLARHRWIEDPLTISPSCIDSVEIVTMEEIMADYEESFGN